MAYDGEALEAINMAVPPYEEDTAEEFTGPGFPGYSEYEGDEFYEDDDEDPELNAPISEPSAAQRVGSHEPSQAGILRDYTQLGAAPGSANIERALPGDGDIEPGGPPQSSNAAAVEFASSGDEVAQTPR